MKKTQSWYFDYAATTPLDPRVLKTMMPFLKEKSLQGNPSSLHWLGRQAKLSLERARTDVADILEVLNDEIIFTGSGTESDNLAVFGTARSYHEKGSHLLISALEHKAVTEVAKVLKKTGFSVSVAPVDKNGLVDIPQLLAQVRHDTILVSVMYVNNEVGSIQSIKEIANGLKKLRHGKELPLFHVDACQAPTILPLKPRALGVDLLTLNGAKLYGPKGTGCLWVRHGIKLSPIIYGGGQEFNMRSGTENLAQIVGFAKALELAQHEAKMEWKRLAVLNKLLRQGIGHIDGTFFNSPSRNASPGILNVSFEGIEGESLLLELDRYGIFCSTGSACAATDLKPSPVLRAMGISAGRAHASLRFSIGRFTTVRDVNALLRVLPKAVARIRSLCPPLSLLTIKEPSYEKSITT